jgi:MarR family transcriptional regulator, organic hydroperoxide resistance regulator
VGKVSLDLDDQLCFALYAATHEMTRSYRPLLDRLNLTYPQYLVMLVLWEHDARRISDLATQLHLPAHALSPILKRMEDAGLITRRRNDTDKRVTDVVLQPAGKALKSNAYGVADSVACATGLTDSEVATLRSRLHDLSDQLAAALEHNSQQQEAT